MLTTSGTLPWSFVTQIFHGHGGDRKTFEVMTSTYAIGILGSVGSLLAATLYQGITEGNHKPWDIVSTQRSSAGMLLHINAKFAMGKL